MRTQAFFYQNLSFKVPVWPWKGGKGHQNLIFPQSQWYICVSLVQFHLLMGKSAYKTHLLSIYNVVTLKIGSRSPKSNHFFPPSWWCICARLVKFQPFVKEILCTQTFYCINKALFLSIYNVVTLKIRPRSSKSNHFFPPSWWCICASLVKFHHWLKRYWAYKLFTSLTRLL